MTTPFDLNALERKAQSVTGCSTVNQAWLDTSEDVAAAVVGHIDEEGNTYPVVTVDCDQYYSGDSLPLAKFYAAANPATVLELIRRVREAEERADFAWRNTNVIERDRQSKCAELVACQLREKELEVERDQWKEDAIHGGNATYLREQLAAASVRVRQLESAIDEQMVSTQLGVFESNDDPARAIKLLMDWSQDTGAFHERDLARAVIEEAEAAITELMKYNPRTRNIGGVEFPNYVSAGAAICKVLDACDTALTHIREWKEQP